MYVICKGVHQQSAIFGYESWEFNISEIFNNPFYLRSSKINNCQFKEY